MNVLTPEIAAKERMKSKFKIVPAPQAYDAPPEALEDRGELFAFIMASCYGPVPGTLLDSMNISRQTMWSWRQPGAGVPKDREDDIRALIANPKEPFRLPRNATIEMILRPVRGRAPLICVRNPYLVDLLLMMVSGKVSNLSAGTLDAIINTHMHGIRGPHIFWRWAYAGGGVPTSHIIRFENALFHYGLPAAMNMSEESFSEYMATKLAAPDTGDPDTDDD